MCVRVREKKKDKKHSVTDSVLDSSGIKEKSVDKSK